MCSIFRFSSDDLPKKIVDFFGGPGLSVQHFGMSQKEYTSLYELNNELVEGDTPSIKTLKKHGFHCFDYVRMLYAKANIFNSYHVQEKNPNDHDFSEETVFSTMEWRYTKACKFHPNISHVPPPTSGNLVEYLSNFTIEEFACIGW
jgi:hypothetical protein